MLLGNPSILSNTLYGCVSWLIVMFGWTTFFKCKPTFKFNRVALALK